jgi:hypothetical protein
MFSAVKNDSLIAAVKFPHSSNILFSLTSSTHQTNLQLKTTRRIFFVTAIVFTIIITLSQCISNNDQAGNASSDPRGEAFAGASACANCHTNIYNSFLHTAHMQTSAAASAETVKGSFNPHANEYFYNEDVKVVMEQRDSALYQVAYKNDKEIQASRFDVVIGSGRKAQTFLYWYDEKAYQLPISYFVPANNWVNSPGYPPKQVRFDRNVPIGCFECHSSNIQVTSNEVAGDRIIDNFNKTSIIFGIDCERCHGPAKNHAQFHEKNPNEKASMFISKYASLSRQQKVDMCAVCHSGMQQTLKSTFDFKPGDTLLNNYFTPSAPVRVDELDVHGNQAQLLAASACFIKSKSLTCNSCHNTHVTERKNMALFSKRCMSCHSPATHNFCTMAPKPGITITNNCIDCHMPAKPSRMITLLSNGDKTATPNFVRTHYITVYPGETKKQLPSTE